MILENYLKMEMFKFYEVGGKVRDELLGLTNKDIDYVAVKLYHDIMKVIVNG